MVKPRVYPSLETRKQTQAAAALTGGCCLRTPGVLHLLELAA